MQWFKITLLNVDHLCWPYILGLWQSGHPPASMAIDQILTNIQIIYLYIYIYYFFHKRDVFIFMCSFVRTAWINPTWSNSIQLTSLLHTKGYLSVWVFVKMPCFFSLCGHTNLSWIFSKGNFQSYFYFFKIMLEHTQKSFS